MWPVQLEIATLETQLDNWLPVVLDVITHDKYFADRLKDIQLFNLLDFIPKK